MSAVLPGATRRPMARRLLTTAIVVCFLGFLTHAVVSQWPQVRVAIGELAPAAVLAAGAATAAGVWCSYRCWRAVLVDFGSVLPEPAAMRVFFVGQAGKYVPGKVWPILTQVRLGRDHQVPGRASAAAAAVFMAVVLGTGLLAAVATLPVLGLAAFGRYWPALLVLPAAAVALWPPILNRLLAWSLRLARRDPMPRPLSLAGIGRSAGWALAMWLLFGAHMWALLGGIGVAAPQLPVRALGAFAGAWAIGFLLLVAPAGVGPREVALVLLLSDIAPQPVALVVAAVSRLLMTLADLVWPLAVLPVAWRGRQRAGAGHRASAP